MKPIVKFGLLSVWIVSHIVVAVRVDTTWWLKLAPILATPVYVWLVHRLDVSWRLGGVHWWLRENPPAAGASGRIRAGAANQSVQITTGFAALLMFNTLRYLSDLGVSAAGESRTILSLAAIAFCLACVLNLVQILLLRLLDRADISSNDGKRLRKLLRFLYSIAWHSLITPVILLLLLLPWSYPALLVNLLYGTFLWIYSFTVIREPPVTSAQRGEGKANGRIRHPS